MTDDAITVDARTDDTDSNVDLETPDPEAEADGELSPEDLAELAEEDARERLHNATGETKLEQAENAAEEIQQTYRTHAQQLNQTKQQLQKAQTRETRLETTIERVENHPEDCALYQDLAGGVTAEVPAERDDGFDREALLDDLEESYEVVSERVDSLEDRVPNMEQEVQRLQLTGRELMKTRKMLDESE